jgi:hypothetical protein
MVPDFSARRSLSMDELGRLDDPAVIFEHFHVDDDGAHAYIYTVAGRLSGREVATVSGARALGCTVGDDVIVVHASSREDADAQAVLGLEDTINLARSGPPADANAGLATHSQILRL